MLSGRNIRVHYIKQIDILMAQTRQRFSSVNENPTQCACMQKIAERERERERERDGSQTNEDMCFKLQSTLLDIIMRV